MAKACRVNMDSKLLFLKWNRLVQILIIKLFNKLTIYQPYNLSHIFLYILPKTHFLFTPYIALFFQSFFYLPPKHTVKCSNWSLPIEVIMISNDNAATLIWSMRWNATTI